MFLAGYIGQNKKVKTYKRGNCVIISACVKKIGRKVCIRGRGRKLKGKNC